MKRISILIILALFCSCRSVKSVKEKTTDTKTTEKTDIRRDSSNIKEISKGINDNISLSLRTNNKVVDSILKSRLKGFMTSKKSGDNSYSAKFDYDNMILDIEAIIAQSSKEKITTDSDTKTEKSFEQTTDEYISKKIKSIPIWVFILIGLYFLPKILAGVNSIINPIQTIITKIRKS
jgi:Fe2+ transport system protein B